MVYINAGACSSSYGCVLTLPVLPAAGYGSKQLQEHPFSPPHGFFSKAALGFVSHYSKSPVVAAQCCRVPVWDGDLELSQHGSCVSMPKASLLAATVEK